MELPDRNYRASRFAYFTGGAIATLLGSIPLTAAPSLAQLSPDASLGAESSIVIPDATVRGVPASLIEGGASLGSSLFHSFAEFNVNTGQAVYFANPSDIQNILTRVTGGSVSSIDCLLGVDGAANLFLLNPNGVIFGPNARLDISGSFTTSTGNSFTFADGSVFSAVPTGNEVLTMSVPLGVQFNDVAQGDITAEGNLAVGVGQTLTLFGEVVLNSGNLAASGGTVQVLGNRVGLISQATIDVSNPQDGGTILIGGDYQGQATVPVAKRTFVGPDVTLNADATTLGNGGRVIVWADEATRFEGSISAQGGPEGGNGGFVEVSGLVSLDFSGIATTQATNGTAGQLLLDPANIVISNERPLGFVTIPSVDPVFADFLYGELEDPGLNSHLTTETVESLLDLNDLFLEATDSITVLDDVNAFSQNDLTLRASEISILARLGQSGGGDIILETPQVEGNFVLVDAGRLDTDVRFGTTVNGGNIRITSHDVIVQNNGILSASTLGEGNSGQVFITATGDTWVEGQGSFIANQVGSEAVGDSGGVMLTTNNLFVSNGAEISASTFGQGNSGQLIITVTKDTWVEDQGSFIGSQVGSEAVGDSGGVMLTTNNLSVLNGAEVSANTFGRGDSGQLLIIATGDIRVEGQGAFIGSLVALGAVGNSGGVTLNTSNLSVLDGAEVSASTLGEGNSGQLLITATGDTWVEGQGSFISSQVGSEAVGDSGGVTLTTNNLSVFDGAQIAASTFGQGNSGQVFITATGDTWVEGQGTFIDSRVEPEAVGDSGGVTLTTNNLSVLNGAEVSANTFGRGDSGQLIIIATGDIRVEGQGAFIGSLVALGAVGNSGGVTLTTNNLSVINGAVVSADTFGQGNAGQLLITATGDTWVEGQGSFISSTVEPEAVGDSGSVRLTTNNLSVLNGAVVSARTLGEGNSGQVFITATGDTWVEGQGTFIESQVGSEAVGDSSGVMLTTNNLSVLNGAVVSANTFGQGDSGQLLITATGDIRIEGQGAFIGSLVALGAVGDSGGVMLTTNNLSVLNGAVVSASTFGQGRAGALEVASLNDSGLNITLGKDSRIVAATHSQARGGDLTIRSNRSSTIQGPGRISVESATVDGGAAGNLNVNASTLALRDGVELSVNSASQAGGGNINIAVDGSLFMSGGSYINATSTNSSAGDGGNVTITLGNGFLIAAPGQDNDIIANAVGGNGGNINISALRLFGFSLQDEPNVARLRGNGTNDISASSEVGLPGAIALNTLDLDPSQGLIELPVDLTDRANQVTPGCGLGNTDDGSEFVVTGRGGLPPNPNDPIAANSVDVPWVVPDEEAPVAQVFEPETTTADPLVEAQGIALDANGNSYFVAEASSGAVAERAQVAPQPCAIAAHP